MPRPKLALLAVYDKTGIGDVARRLLALGYGLLGSRGTAKALRQAELPVMEIPDLVVPSTARLVEQVVRRLLHGDLPTGLDHSNLEQALRGQVGEPILDHRVVTLVWEVYAALLSDQDNPAHLRQLDELGLPVIDFVYNTFYPLGQAVAAPDATEAHVIELTDIGGPTLVRAAAKGNRIVVCRQAMVDMVLIWMERGYANRPEMISRLAATAEAVVASYCLTSASFRGQGLDDGLVGERRLTCKYGENAWQNPAALYATVGAHNDPLALHRFQQRAGTEPSFNNLCDLDRGLQTLTHLAAACDVNDLGLPLLALGIKHGNVCGAALGFDQEEVVRQMVAGDPRALFGGGVLLNFPLSEELAVILRRHRASGGQERILDWVAAPDMEVGAIDRLRRKKGDKCRLMTNPNLANLDRRSLDTAPRRRPVRGGYLRQPNYTQVTDLTVFGLDPASDLESAYQLLLAKEVCDTGNSNTITLVQGCMVIGNAVGQQDRVTACELAVRRAREAGHDTAGAVAASDSFFPFPDGPETLADAGVGIIITSSGSINDAAVGRCCRERGLKLYWAPDSEVRGFYGH